jgi:DNA-binding transcriptional LysR family regulator
MYSSVPGEASDVQYLVLLDYDLLHMDRDLELRHLRYFVAVAEELHFGRAARRLHLAQPPLSQQIRKLEEILGYPLFVRTSRSVKLTTAGEAFLQSAHRTLSKVQRDVDDARSIGRGEVGSLHVGFIGSAMLTGLPGVLRAYRETYPRVRLHLHESFTARVIEGLQDGTLDAGILRDGDSVEGLTVTTIFSEPFVVVLPVTHPRARQKSIAPASLLSTKRRNARFRKTFHYLRRARFSPPDRTGSITLAYNSATDWGRIGYFHRTRMCTTHCLAGGGLSRSAPYQGGQQSRAGLSHWGDTAYCSQVCADCGERTSFFCLA